MYMLCQTYHIFKTDFFALFPFFWQHSVMLFSKGRTYFLRPFIFTLTPTCQHFSFSLLLFSFLCCPQMLVLSPEVNSTRAGQAHLCPWPQRWPQQQWQRPPRLKSFLLQWHWLKYGFVFSMTGAFDSNMFFLCNIAVTCEIPFSTFETRSRFLPPYHVVRDRDFYLPIMWF